MCSKLYVSIFFTFKYTNVKHLRGTDVSSPMSDTLCHPVSFTFNHFVDYVPPCVCLLSPYHAVIIKLQNKQYNLFVYFLELSKRVSPKAITDTLSIFEKHINSENMNFIGMLLRVIIKLSGYMYTKVKV